MKTSGHVTTCVKCTWHWSEKSSQRKWIKKKRSLSLINIMVCTLVYICYQFNVVRMLIVFFTFSIKSVLNVSRLSICSSSCISVLLCELHNNSCSSFVYDVN